MMTGKRHNYPFRMVSKIDGRVFTGVGWAQQQQMLRDLAEHNRVLALRRAIWRSTAQGWQCR